MAALSGYVPHFDLSGSHHSREPFRDKSRLLTAEIRHPTWLSKPPDVRTFADLRQAQHRRRVPDYTYDLDGDGTVGQMDLFIGSRFDKDGDGRLTTAERGKAREAMKSKEFMGQFVMGLEASGKDGQRVIQRHGEILDAVNSAATAYGPHHNSHLFVPHSTQTALKLSRTAELKEKANLFADRLGANRAQVVEPQPPNHRTMPRRCPFEHMSEIREANRQAARSKGGLTTTSQPINPEREFKEVGMQPVVAPAFPTRSGLVDVRREATKRDAEALRIRGEEKTEERMARKTQLLAEEEARQRQTEPRMTFTRLADQRRKDKVGYDETHFTLPCGPSRTFPRFADNPEVPFWLADGGGDSAPSSSPVHSSAMPRALSEPVLKVTDVPFDHWTPGRRTPAQPLVSQALATAGHPSGAPKEPNENGSHTVKRWTTEILERGAMRNKPRLFDSIQPASIGPKDWEPLELTSSLEPIRTQALRKQAEERKNAWHRRSSLKSHLAEDGVDATKSEEFRHLNTVSTKRNGNMGGNGVKRNNRQTDAITTMPFFAADSLMSSFPGGVSFMESTAEPRFFGSTTMARSASEAAIRCGGFTRDAAPAPLEPEQSRSRKQNR